MMSSFHYLKRRTSLAFIVVAFLASPLILNVEHFSSLMKMTTSPTRKTTTTTSSRFFVTRSLKQWEATPKFTEDDLRRIRDLRGLFFGTSRTWGTGLAERRSAYPWKVTQGAVKNLAIRGTGPQFASMCFRSMIDEDDIFDFVVFEYFHILMGTETTKLADLAQRVRARFPNATLIFLMVPIVHNYLHVPSQQTLISRLRSVGGFLTQSDRDLYSPIPEEALDRVVSEAAAATSGGGDRATRNATQDWMLNDPLDRRREVERAASLVNGYVWSPLEHRNHDNTQMKHLAGMFFRDGIHYSPHGHDVIAMNVQALLARHNATRSDVVGEWDSYDSCHTWYENGNVTLEHSPMSIYKWARGDGLTKGKHALEVRKPSSWIRVNNPTARELNLFAYYMATRPVQHYPEMSIVVSTSRFVGRGRLENHVMVDPVVPYTIGKQSLHIIKGTNLGKVGPGDHFVHFHPESDTGRPFRITGMALSEKGDEKKDMEGFFQ